MTVIKHVGLACSTEENADRFYGDLLGLEKMESKILPADLSKQIFDLDKEYRMINYTGDHAHFEIFICPERVLEDRVTVDHACIEVDRLEEFLDRCGSAEAEIRKIPKGDKVLVFVRDFDGNLFEVKEKSGE